MSHVHAHRVEVFIVEVDFEQLVGRELVEVIHTNGVPNQGRVLRVIPAQAQLVLFEADTCHVMDVLVVSE